MAFLLATGLQTADAQIAPNFTIVNHATGQPLSLYDYQGSVILLDFWAYWCIYCQLGSADVEPNIAEYYSDAGGNVYGVPVTVISISIDLSDPAAEDSFIQTYGLQLVGDDASEVSFQPYNNNNGIPEYVVINGLTNSANTAPWAVVTNQTGYLTNFTVPILKAAIDSVQGSQAAYAAVTTTASPTNAGTVSGSGTNQVGTQVQLTATPFNGWIFTGWSDGNTQNPRTVTVTSKGAAYTADFAQAGALQVTISPAQVISNGAQWQVDGGTLQDSGATVSNLTLGTHTVSFTSVSYWTTPANQIVSITTNSPATATGVYAVIGNGPTGALNVTLSPAGAASAGAHWQLDYNTNLYDNGQTVTNLSIGAHTLTFTTVPGWGTPAVDVETVTVGATTTYTAYYTMLANTQTGALRVTLQPAAAVSAGAMWQVDGGPGQTNGATVTLLTGSHTVSFTSTASWAPPPSQTVTIASSATTAATGLYSPSVTSSTGLGLETNGDGIIEHGPWPKVLVIGKTYTVTAIPRPGNLFSNWAGGTILPYSVLSTSADYTFAMQSNLVLQANFVTNVFSSGEGSYRGLFGPSLAPRSQTNSGAFSLEVSENGGAFGTLSTSSQTMAFAGKFDPAGAATIVSRLPGDEYPLTITLQLNFSNQSVSGTVSDGIFYSTITAYRIVFDETNNATAFKGVYNLIIPGTNNAAEGPLGTSYATVTVDDSGRVTMAGSLADGTAISQSSVVSKDGYWPLYINLYGGKGSLWGWNYFTNNTVTSAPILSWINATNLSPRAIYRAGFFDQKATLTGNLYVPHNVNLQSGTVILQGGNLPETLTISNLADNMAGLVLKLNSKTGVITGSFVSPDDAKRTIKLQGVLIQTNAQGYFLGTNESGVFTLDLP